MPREWLGKFCEIFVLVSLQFWGKLLRKVGKSNYILYVHNVFIHLNCYIFIKRSLSHSEVIIKQYHRIYFKMLNVKNKEDLGKKKHTDRGQIFKTSWSYILRIILYTKLIYVKVWTTMSVNENDSMPTRWIVKDGNLSLTHFTGWYSKIGIYALTDFPKRRIKILGLNTQVSKISK